MKAITKATARIYLMLFAIAGICNISYAQDTLILKPTRKNPQGDTLIVKLAMVFFAKEISYFPYENFELTQKDKKILADGKMIKRKGQTEIDVFSVEKILYDEAQKHTIKFVDKNFHKIKRFEELRSIKNVLSLGTTYTSLPTYALEINVLGADETEYYPSQHAIFLQPTYERFILKGMMGLRLSPMIALNKQAHGIGVGSRIYVNKQKPFNFGLGADVGFVNSTIYRMFSPEKPNEPNYLFRKRFYKKENKNELYISPIVLQCSYTLNNNYHFSFDLSMGVRTLLSNKTFIHDGEPHKYKDSPAFGQLRLNIGKKF